MAYTQLVIVTPIDLTPEELDLGDRLEFLTKMNSQMTKLQDWTTLFATSVQSINDLGAELEATQNDDAAAIAAMQSDIDSKLAKTGGAATGNLSISGAAATSLYFALKTATGYTPNMTFSINNVEQGRLYTTPTALVLKRKGQGGGSDTRLNLLADYCNITKELRGIPATNSAGLVTKAQMDTFLPISGAVSTGDLYVQKAAAALTLNANIGTDPSLYLAVDGATSFVIYSDPVKTTIGYVPGTQNLMEFFENYSVFGKEVRGVDATNSNGFVTRSQTVLRSGSTMTGNLVITKSFPVIALTPDNLSDPIIKLGDGTVDTAGELRWDSSVPELRLSATSAGTGSGTDNFLRIRGEYSYFSKELRGEQATSSNGFVTKAQMEGATVPKTGGVVTGNLSIDNSTTNAQINLDTQGTGNSRVLFQNGSISEAVIEQNGAFLSITNYDSVGGNNYLRLYDSYSRFEKEVRGVNATDPAGFVTKAQMDAAIAAAIA